MISLEGELELSTLRDWIHVQSAADNRDLLEILMEGLAEARARVTEARWRHQRDSAAEQEAADLAQMVGVVGDMYRWQRRQPHDPQCYRDFSWMLWA
jgi:hypothetical protein